LQKELLIVSLSEIPSKFGRGATVASGSGFTALADYIFGNNAKKEKYANVVASRRFIL